MIKLFLIGMAVALYIPNSFADMAIPEKKLITDQAVMLEKDPSVYPRSLADLGPKYPGLKKKRTSVSVQSGRSVKDECAQKSRVEKAKNRAIKSMVQ